MNHDDSDSLDLLLDTITNTFGGILFIAMLVVVLVSLTQPRRERRGDDSSALASTSQDLARLEYERSVLERSLRLQKVTWEESRSPETRALLEEVARLDDAVATLDRTQDQLRQQIEEYESQIKARKEQAEELQRKASQLEEEIPLLVRSIRKELEQMRVAGQKPVLKHAETVGFTAVLRYGKLYFPDRFDTTGTIRTGVNLDEMIILSESVNEIIITPNPAAGTDANDARAVRERFESLPSLRSPQTTHIVVCVWDDSFGEFGIVRRVLVELGYRYRLILVPTGDGVTESPDVTEFVQ